MIQSFLQTEKNYISFAAELEIYYCHSIEGSHENLQIWQRKVLDLGLAGICHDISVHGLSGTIDMLFSDHHQWKEKCQSYLVKNHVRFLYSGTFVLDFDIGITSYFYRGTNYLDYFVLFCKGQKELYLHLVWKSRYLKCINLYCKMGVYESSNLRIKVYWISWKRKWDILIYNYSHTGRYCTYQLSIKCLRAEVIHI